MKPSKVTAASIVSTATDGFRMINNEYGNGGYSKHPVTIITLADDGNSYNFSVAPLL